MNMLLTSAAHVFLFMQDSYEGSSRIFGSPIELSILLNGQPAATLCTPKNRARYAMEEFWGALKAQEPSGLAGSMVDIIVIPEPSTLDPRNGFPKNWMPWIDHDNVISDWKERIKYISRSIPNTCSLRVYVRNMLTITDMLVTPR